MNKRAFKIYLKAYSVEWIMLLIAFLTLLSFFTYSVISEKDSVVKREEERLTAQTKILSDNITRQLVSSSEALKVIRQEIESSNMKDEKVIENLNENLKLFTRVIPIIRAFVAMDKDGNVIASNRDDIINFNYSKREYFINQKSTGERDKLSISSPYKSVLGVWTINLSLILNDEKGDFAGVVLVTFDPKAFEELLGSVSYAHDMSAAIIHENGTLFLVTPNNDENLGQNLNEEGTLFYRHIKSNKNPNTFNDFLYFLNENRFVTFYTIKPNNLNMDYSLVVAVSRDYNFLIEKLEKEIIYFIVLFLMIIASSTIILYLFQKSRYSKRLKEISMQKVKESKLESLAYLDTLTKLPNRRYFEQYLEQQWKHCLRNEQHLSLIMIDIDHFKIYNDTYGHIEGDNCLRKVAKTLKSTMNRPQDFVARYGGEEFICVLPNTNSKGASVIAQKLIEAIKDLKIENKDSKVLNTVTISLGISSIIPNEDSNSEIVLKSADEALYLSKNSGRDKYTVKDL